MSKKKLQVCGDAPCKACPWRKTSAAGWLGQSSPERFVLATWSGVLMPCHATIDYADPRWETKWERRTGSGKLCVGALTFLRNNCKSSRDPQVPQVSADVAVFREMEEFIAHHRSGGRSWSDEEDQFGKLLWAAFCRTRNAGLAFLEMTEVSQ